MGSAAPVGFPTGAAPSRPAEDEFGCASLQLARLPSGYGRSLGDERGDRRGLGQVDGVAAGSFGHG
jgi:hypothetical protein